MKVREVLLWQQCVELKNIKIAENLMLVLNETIDQLALAYISVGIPICRGEILVMLL